MKKLILMALLAITTTVNAQDVIFGQTINKPINFDGYQYMGEVNGDGTAYYKSWKYGFVAVEVEDDIVVKIMYSGGGDEENWGEEMIINLPIESNEYSEWMDLLASKENAETVVSEDEIQSKSNFVYKNYKYYWSINFDKNTEEYTQSIIITDARY